MAAGHGSRIASSYLGALVVLDVVTSVVVVVGATTVLMTTVVDVVGTVVGPHSLSM